MPVSRQIANGVLGFAGTVGGQLLRLSVTRDRCGDGMSDRSYPFTITLLIDGRKLAGCGYAGERPPQGSVTGR